MTVDILDVLGTLAPRERDLEARWPVEDRAELAASILAGQVDADARLRHRAPRRRGRRPRMAIMSLVAGVAVATIVAPALLPHDAPGAPSPAAAAALHHLAVVAAGTPADTLAPGEFVQTVVRDHQVGVPENPELGAVVQRSRTETWTAYDGRSWTRSTSPGDAGPTTLFAKAYPESGAAYFASLPTDATELGRYLRRHAHGSSSKDEAVFLAVGDLMANDTAPAALRSAAATALAGTDHVRLGPATTDDLGRSITEFDFVDQTIRPGQVQAFLVDRATAQVVGRRTSQPGSSYEQTLVSSQVVAAVPQDVLRTACPVNGPLC
jgi:hypothetical protein